VLGASCIHSVLLHHANVADLHAGNHKVISQLSGLQLLQSLILLLSHKVLYKSRRLWHAVV